MQKEEKKSPELTQLKKQEKLQKKKKLSEALRKNLLRRKSGDNS